MSLVLIEDAGAIRILTLNQAEHRNPISSSPMVEALTLALNGADSDLGVRAVILTGAGSAFSSGGDVKRMRAGGGLRDALPARTRLNYKGGIQRLPLLFQSIEVPVVAAINGPAIGAGCDLACMCDIRIAGRSARFAESFVKLGLIPGDGGAWLLPRIVGFSKATELSLTGETLDAEGALACGLVSRVVDDERLLEVTMEVAMKIAANPPYAVRMTKRLLREAQTNTLAATLELSSALQAISHHTQDHDEALRAALERRTPTYLGS